MHSPLFTSRNVFKRQSFPVIFFNMKLQGSCHCNAVRFSVVSQTPYPYMRCYCSICRKTSGSGGFGINIMGLKDTLQVEGQENLGEFHAMMEAPSQSESIQSSNARFFCTKCGCHLWAYDDAYKQWVYPYAGAVDTPLPTPPCSVHIMLNSKSAWVQPEVGPKDSEYGEYPELGIEEWHKRHGLFMHYKEDE